MPSLGLSPGSSSDTFVQAAGKRVRLRNVNFDTWLRSHGKKDPEERWLRELYPWPVLAQVDCDSKHIGRPQRISYADAQYDVTLTSILWQPQRGTFRYRLRVESEGLGWHSRSFSDFFDLCATPNGAFVTLFHKSKEEPLEQIAKAFFNRRWEKLDTPLFRTLAVSRFLAASVVARVAELAFADVALTHYPDARLVGGTGPMFASGSELGIGYRFFSEDAYAWARKNAGSTARTVALYFADTKYQFLTDLPGGAEVKSIAQLDAEELGSRHEDFINVLLRGLDLPSAVGNLEQLKAIVLGQSKAPQVQISEGDVHEALAALKRPCSTKGEFRYQLAAAVILNSWIENERRLGIANRKKFYAFKQKVGELAQWASQTQLSDVRIWAEADPVGPILYVRVDDVDFSFHAIPGAKTFLTTNTPSWSGVRLKPIAPLVLAWARAERRV